MKKQTILHQLCITMFQNKEGISFFVRLGSHIVQEEGYRLKDFHSLLLLLLFYYLRIFIQDSQIKIM